MNYPGVSLSLRMLMELMLQISDNSATDVLLQYAGGADAVTNHLRSLGIDGITVSRSCLELISDWLGADKLPTQVRQPLTVSVGHRLIMLRVLHCNLQPTTWEEADVGAGSWDPQWYRDHQATNCAAELWEADTARDHSTPDGMTLCKFLPKSAPAHS
jgi:hypothetical protein